MECVFWWIVVFSYSVHITLFIKGTLPIWPHWSSTFLWNALWQPHHHDPFKMKYSSSDSNKSLNGAAFTFNDTLDPSPVGSIQNDVSRSPPEYLTTPLLTESIQSKSPASPLNRSLRSKFTPRSGRSLKDVFQSRKRNMTLDELPKVSHSFYIPFECSMQCCHRDNPCTLYILI